MFDNIKKYVYCPFCKKSLRKVLIISDECAIFSCQCSTYPLVEGILYLKKDKIRQKLINKITKRKNFLYLFAFSLSTMLIFRLINLKSIIKKISFKKFIELIVLFGYNKNFAEYIFTRKNRSSFFINLVALDLIDDPSQLTLDLGCGVGQFFPFFYKHSHPNNFFAIDRDFFNLYIAKKYFTKPGTVLICCDINNGLPIKNNKIDTFFATDALHYFYSADLFAKELRRITKNSSQGAIIHTYNTNHNPSHNCHRRKPKNVESLFKKRGFKNLFTSSSSSLFSTLNKKNFIELIKEKNINNAPVYNILITHRKRLKLRNDYRIMLEQTKADIDQGAYLT